MSFLFIAHSSTFSKISYFHLFLLCLLAVKGIINRGKLGGNNTIVARSPYPSVTAPKTPLPTPTIIAEPPIKIAIGLAMAEKVEALLILTKESKAKVSF